MEKSAPSYPELLANWLSQRREPAFHAIVARYAGLVQSTARRTCGDDSLAEEASQLTFITLAQKAKSLTSCTSLGGWLHLTAMMHAKNLLRKSHRENRKRQLLQAAMETEPPHTSNDTWQELQPVLDEALADLSAKDREAILLRFYRSLTVREIATTLGIATDAAQKRLDRATERLRAKLARRGCQAGGSLSAAMLAGFAADAQAATLSVSVITTKSIAAGTVGTSVATLLSTITAMKATSLLIPALSLGLAGAWLGSQYLSNSSLDSQITALEKTIAASDSANKADTQPAKLITTKQAKQAKQTKEPFDWKEIAAQIAEMEGPNDTIASLRRVMKLQQRLQAMTKEELITALDENTALDLPKETRDVLAQLLIGHLAQKDPEYALKKFIDRVQDNSSMSWKLANAMQEWAKKDPTSAISWFDQQIAVGKFESKSLDGKSQTRIQFEAGLINVLLGINPDAAGRRLAALHEDQRGEAMLPDYYRPPNEEDQAAFAKLVRDQIPEKDQAKTLAEKAAFLANLEGNFSKVSEFLDRIQATPAERTACVERAAMSQIENISQSKKITREDLDPMREWVTTQTPEFTASLTGRALAYASQIGPNMDFQEAADLAVEYHKTDGNDDVLHSFLRSSAFSQNIEQARLLAEKISDQKRRVEILKNLR